MSTREFFAAMEAGELMADDVLPKVAKEFARTARDGGALSAAMDTARISQRQFTTAAQEGADIVFQAGFGEGIANMFQTLTNALEDSKGGLKGLGKTFKLVFDSIALAVKMVTPILNHAFKVIGAFADVINRLFVNDIGGIVAGVGMFALALWRVKKVVGLLDLAFSSMLAKIYPIYWVLKEFVATMSRGVVGDIELALGKDVSISDLGGDRVRKEVEAVKRSGFGGMESAFVRGFAREQEVVRGQNNITKQENSFTIYSNDPEAVGREVSKQLNQSLNEATYGVTQ